MVQPGPDAKLTTLSTFYPQFTYPIFGDEETIFGYKDLRIALRFAAHDLRSNVNISYSERFKKVEEIEAMDLNKALKQFLPEGMRATLPCEKQGFRIGFADDMPIRVVRPAAGIREVGLER